MSDIALTVSILALVAVVGLFIGNVKFRGIGLGIGGVLFGGIIVGHFVSQAGMTLSSDMLHVIQEFGLILFRLYYRDSGRAGLLCLIARLRITPQPVCCSDRHHRWSGYRHPA
ncbi:putative transport protein YidE [Escherichia coli]|uniref:Putative transport protein YidE n=1 Tax=Escherichia coli TaxID=562 RepID=A0A2X1NBT3_ECOLX|nr:putative transport protein YidE [Escherichia coli]